MSLKRAERLPLSRGQGRRIFFSKENEKLVKSQIHVTPAPHQVLDKLQSEPGRLRKYGISALACQISPSPRHGGIPHDDQKKTFYEFIKNRFVQKGIQAKV
jgi:hypothetical protein